MTASRSFMVRNFGPLLSKSGADRGIEIAYNIAEQVATPTLYMNAIEHSYGQTSFRKIGESLPASLAHGTAGAAVLCSVLFRVTGEARWQERAHSHLLTAIGAPISDLSLMLGLAGLALALDVAAHDGTSYAGARKQCTRRLANELPCIPMMARCKAQHVGDYDICAGLAGIHLVADDETRKMSGLALEAMLMNPDKSFSVGAGTYDEAGEWSVVGDGIGVGMAHGIAGVLASASSGCLSGDDNPACQSDALHRGIEFLLAQSCDEGARITWPSHVGVAPVARATWCYGTMGIAHSLYLAGVRTGDFAVQDFAIRALMSEGCIIPPDTHGLCHGKAGVATMLHLTALHSANEKLLARAAAMYQEIIADYDSRYSLGYRTMMRGEFVDEPDFVDGAVGVALALLSACDPKAVGGWQRILGSPISAAAGAT